MIGTDQSSDDQTMIRRGCLTIDIQDEIDWWITVSGRWGTLCSWIRTQVMVSGCGVGGILSRRCCRRRHVRREWITSVVTLSHSALHGTSVRIADGRIGSAHVRHSGSGCLRRVVNHGTVHLLLKFQKWNVLFASAVIKAVAVGCWELAASTAASSAAASATAAEVVRRRPPVALGRRTSSCWWRLRFGDNFQADRRITKLFRANVGRNTVLRISPTGYATTSRFQTKQKKCLQKKFFTLRHN